MITPEPASDLRIVTAGHLRLLAARLEEIGRKGRCVIQPGQAAQFLIDADELRELADELRETARPRTQREREGDARRAATAGLWGTFRRLWSRAA